MTFRLIISHFRSFQSFQSFQVRFLGLRLAARNILFDVFHILTPSDVAYEKYFSFMVVYIVYAYNTLTKNSSLKVISNYQPVLSPDCLLFVCVYPNLMQDAQNCKVKKDANSLPSTIQLTSQ